MSDEAIFLAEAGEANPIGEVAAFDSDDVDSVSGINLEGSSVDLTDGFYQFRASAVACYHGLDFHCTAGEVADIIGEELRCVWDDDAEDWVEVDF